MDGFDLNCFLPFRLNRVAAEVSERLSGLYRERFDLDIAQWRVLATLSSAEAATAEMIVASTRTHKSTVSRAVAGLLARKLVARSGSAADARVYRLRLTAGGRKLFRTLAPVVLAYERDLMAGLGKAGAAALGRSLAALEAALNLGSLKPLRQTCPPPAPPAPQALPPPARPSPRP